MKNNTLVIITDIYPLVKGGTFVVGEIMIYSSYFEYIYLFVKEEESTIIKQYELPKNVKIYLYKNDLKYKNVKYIINIFSKIFIYELINVLFRFKHILSKNIFKIIYIMHVELIKAHHVSKELERFILNERVNISNTVFYSYWHDYRALSLAYLSYNNKQIKAISRAHGWDVYFRVNKYKYLPYKKFILENLCKTYTISKKGKEEFINILLNKNINQKIDISKLGVQNKNLPKLKKTNKNIVICSCSNLIPIKRVDLIIQLISKLRSNKDILWVHFGYGYLEKELKILAEKQLKHIKYDFRGETNNAEILKFYNDNYVDMFINLSESEGIPVSIMEALSAGIPVLATDVGGTSEAVNNNNGFLIEKDLDIDVGAKIINDYLNSDIDNQKRYRKNAYSFWNDNYNAEKNYINFAKILREID